MATLLSKIDEGIYSDKTAMELPNAPQPRGSLSIIDESDSEREISPNDFPRFLGLSGQERAKMAAQLNQKNRETGRPPEQGNVYRVQSGETTPSVMYRGSALNQEQVNALNAWNKDWASQDTESIQKVLHRQEMEKFYEDQFVEGIMETMNAPDGMSLSGWVNKQLAGLYGQDRTKQAPWLAKIVDAFTTVGANLAMTEDDIRTNLANAPKDWVQSMGRNYAIQRQRRSNPELFKQQLAAQKIANESLKAKGDYIESIANANKLDREGEFTESDYVKLRGEISKRSQEIKSAYIEQAIPEPEAERRMQADMRDDYALADSLGMKYKFGQFAIGKGAAKEQPQAQLESDNSDAEQSAINEYQQKKSEIEELKIPFEEKKQKIKELDNKLKEEKQANKERLYASSDWHPHDQINAIKEMSDPYKKSIREIDKKVTATRKAAWKNNSADNGNEWATQPAKIYNHYHELDTARKTVEGTYLNNSAGGDKKLIQEYLDSINREMDAILKKYPYVESVEETELEQKTRKSNVALGSSAFTVGG